MKYGDKVRFRMEYKGLKENWYKAIFLAKDDNGAIEVYIQFPDGYRTTKIAYIPEYIKEGWKD